METIQNQIIEVLIEMKLHKGRSLTEETKLKEELGIDSLSLTELIIACEEKFNIEINVDDPTIGKIRTINDLSKQIEKLVSSN